MAVRIRLKRMGRKNLPAYRIGVFDGRTRRDGPALEIVGWFNPLMNESGKGFKCETDRLEDWIRRGAKMTLAVTQLLDKQGVKLAAPPAKPAKEKKPAKAAAKPADKGAAQRTKPDPEAVARRKRKLAKRESRRAWKVKKLAAAAKAAAAPAAGA